MDCQMPEMNGYEASTEIRRREGAGSHIPIVAVTASAIKGDEERCLAAGMDAYVTKPVTVQTMGDVLRRLIDRPAGEPDAGGPAHAVRQAVGLHTAGSGVGEGPRS
ncbi:MAG: response regulator, partial [Actinomycetota bacterium]|nr:response regulator [Actinomycetota bacterium]